MQAQGALRQMEKETMLEYEDPDKFFLQEAEEVDGEHPKKSRKGKGRGKGKGKGKGGKGKGKRGGKGAKSKHTPAPAEVAQATEVVEVETSAEAAEAAKAAEVGAETEKPEEEKEKVEPRAQTPQKQRSRKRKQIVSPKLKSPARLAKVLSESAKKKAKVATPEDVKEVWPACVSSPIGLMFFDHMLIKHSINTVCFFIVRIAKIVEPILKADVGCRALQSFQIDAITQGWEKRTREDCWRKDREA